MTRIRGLFSAIASTLLLTAVSCDQAAEGDGGTGGADAGDDAKADGQSGDQCESRPKGSYGNCMGADPSAGQAQFDLSVCGSQDATCVTDQPVKPSAGVCSFGTCESECDCPGAPDSGDATPTCGPIIPGGESECYLDCSQGQICPNDMFCWGGFVCAWAAEASGTPYGDCMNAEVEDACGVMQQCIYDDQMSPSYGVCAEMGCNDVSQCPTPPTSGSAPLTCAPIVYGTPNACYLDCSRGEACPNDMVCFGELVCAFAKGMPGGDDGGTGE